MMRRVSAAVVGLCALCGLSGVCVGQERTDSGPLLLPELLDSVEKTYPLLRVAILDQEGAQAELRSAKGGFDPVFSARADGTPSGAYPGGRFDVGVFQPTPLWGASVFGGYRVSVGEFADYDGKLVTNQYGEARLGLAIPLLRDGLTDRRRTALGQAEAQVDIAQASAQEARLLARRVSGLRYLDWVGAGLRKRVAVALVELAQKRDAGLLERTRRGDLAAIERTDNLRALVARQGLVVAARRAMELSALSLSLFHRNSSGKPILVSEHRLPPELPAPSPPEFGQPAFVEADRQRALQQRPELARLDKQKRQLELALRLAQNQAWPSLDVGAAVSQDFGPPGYPRDKTQVDVSLAFAFPTLNRAALGQVALRKVALEKWEAQKQWMMDQVGVEVSDVHSLLRQAAERVRLAEQEYALAKEVEEGERTRFNLGNSTLLLLNLREQATFDAALKRVDALVEYHRAEVVYRAVLGVL